MISECRPMKAPGIAGLAVILLVAMLTSSCQQLKQAKAFVDSISDGAPCTSDVDCLGGYCLKAAAGFPNGYCTTLKCDQVGCSGLTSQCFHTTIDGKQLAACYKMCNFDGTCDRAKEGYRCVALQDVPVCLPPGASNAPVQGAIGSPCSNNLQCNGTNASCLTSFFGGYCTQTDCKGSATCPNGDPCVALNPNAAPSAQKFACLAGCKTDKDCRFGYTCQQFGGSSVCLEKTGGAAAPRNPNGANDGAACVANINCKGGTCIRETTSGGSTSYTGGYCTTRDCQSDSDCNGSSVCVSRDRATTCMASCSTDADCRSGYVCRQNNQGKGYCDSAVQPVAPQTTTPATASLDVKCGTSKSFTFTVPNGALGFFVAPFTRQNDKVSPTTLQMPDGSTLNIPQAYSFGDINPDVLGSLAPMLFPASNDTKFAHAFGGGKYTLNVQTNASQVCYYVLPTMHEGSTLNINFYLVGVPGLTAQTAPQNADLQKVVATMQKIYNSMGVTVHVAHYFDSSKTVAQKYTIIRNFYDVFNLVATSKAPGTTLADNLSVNVFLIQNFNVSDVPGLLGISTGIPGMAGLHGNSGAGLVFGTASLGSDDVAVGQTMAHEIGHFLGLRHTTEHGGTTHDPITDTPQCVLPSLGYACPDARNFMFPFALGDDQSQTSAGQAFVVRHNPLVQ